MSSDSTVVAPPAADLWATPGDRQRAAREAYQHSIDGGSPLSGVQLGTMFDRSARWGVDRIAEVRSDNYRRSNGSHSSDAASPIGSNGNRRGARPATDGNALPIGSNGNGKHSGIGSGPHPSRRNGSGTAEQVVPIRSVANGRHADEPAEAMPCPKPHAEAPVPTDVGHQQSERRSRSPLDTVITLVVGTVAAAASYGHMLHVALMCERSADVAFCDQ